MREKYPYGLRVHELLHELLKERNCYQFKDEKERKLYYLIGRYEGKVSERLLKLREEIRRDALSRSPATIECLVFEKNPFLSLIPKDEKRS